MTTTVRNLLSQSTKLLEGAVNDAYTDTQALLCHVLNVNRAWLIAHQDDTADKTTAEQVNAVVQRRATGEPVAYITGYKEFWSHRFKVTSDTLIPRPETEHLVEQILMLDLPEKGTSLLDFGTGTGAIAITLGKERPGWDITAIDISTEALSVARENAQNLKVENINFVKGDELNDIGNHKFTVIASNPPYIEEADPHLQQGDVRFEPRVALVSGKDGLDCIRALIEMSPAYLDHEGQLIIEHGFEQGSAVRKILNKNNYTAIRTIRDLSGNERVTMARL